MHIPDYARATIQAALPAFPTSRHVERMDCCLCDEPFQDRQAVPLGPTPESGLFACRSCLTRLVARARRARDAALAQSAEQVHAQKAAWHSALTWHFARLDSVRRAAEAVENLAGGGDTEALQVAWLFVSLESAYTWLPKAPEPPASLEGGPQELKEERFRVDLAMIAAREAVAERLVYHLINEAQPTEPEMCEEFECPEGCSGRHDTAHIDCGPDEIFENLAQYGITVEPPEPDPPVVRAGNGEKRQLLPDIEEHATAVLAHCGIDADDTETLLSAAAVGLVADAWREGPLDILHAAGNGPSDGEIFAQSVDLYRRARAALAAARDDGPDELLAFVAIASDINLAWAGGSSFVLRTASGPVAEFVQHVDDRVWFTTEVMREQGWRAGLLHRAASAVFKGPDHFGMPGWPAVVASGVKRLAALDRAGAPEPLADLAAVEAALLEAPDRLGTDALGWMAHSGVLG